MQNETQTKAISGIIESLLESDPDKFLVEVRIAPGNHIKVFLDGDSGITIEKCVAVNRGLYKKLEEDGLFPGNDFSLEVSSPGLDEPLRLHRQYVKNTGRFVEVQLKDGSRVEGKLTGVTDTEIVVEEIKGRKKEVIKHTLLFENIKTTKIQVVF
jgi:ribosome maturation factor RimP